MCGLVGAVGTLKYTHEKWFKQALLCDTVRGHHSTGVTVVKKNSVDSFKYAIPAAYFMDLAPAKSLINSITGADVVMGHNRHATAGNSGAHVNAHPFKHGDITLMHNGTLTNHRTLTTDHFTVDSEAICAAISREGAEVIVPKLKGAFALVWYDESDGTLNFVRNNERTLFLAISNEGSMLWASEKGMLEWLLSKERKIGITYEEITPLEIGKWLSIPVDNISDVKVKELTLAPKHSNNHSRYQARHNTSTHTAGTNTPIRSRITAHDSAKTALDHIRFEGELLLPGMTVRCASTTETTYTFGKEYTIDKICRYTHDSKIYLEVKNNYNVILASPITTFSLPIGYKTGTNIIPFTTKAPLVQKFMDALADIPEEDKPFVLEKPIKFCVTSFKEYPNGATGELKGIACKYPHCDVIINGVTPKCYKNLMLNNPQKVVQSELLTIKPPEGLTVDDDLTDSNLVNYTLHLYNGSARPAALRKVRAFHSEGERVFLDQGEVEVKKIIEGEYEDVSTLYNVGINNKVTAEEFKKITNRLGCCVCEENQFDPKNHNDLFWYTSDQFLCQSCYSQELDRVNAF